MGQADAEIEVNKVAKVMKAKPLCEEEPLNPNQRSVNLVQGISGEF